MKPHFFRPSCLADDANFLSWHLGTPKKATPLMKRGTIAEQVALRGLLSVAPEWTLLPDCLPENPNGKVKPDGTLPRFTSWKEWSKFSGINPDAENAIGAPVWQEAMRAAQAIRATLPDEFQWQIAGRLPVDVEVPEGFAPEIAGTCDLLLPEAVMDIKVVSSAVERAIVWDYRMQVSAYAHMHQREHAAILAVFPLDDDATRWSSKIVQIEVLPLEAIEEQCRKLVVAYRRAKASNEFKTDLNAPFQKAA